LGGRDRRLTEANLGEKKEKLVRPYLTRHGSDITEVSVIPAMQEV
jgi:hypothetical protein